MKFADGGPKKKKNHQLNISTQWTARRDEVIDLEVISSSYMKGLRVGYSDSSLSTLCTIMTGKQIDRSMFPYQPSTTTLMWPYQTRFRMFYFNSRGVSDIESCCLCQQALPDWAEGYIWGLNSGVRFFPQFLGLISSHVLLTGTLCLHKSQLLSERKTGPQDR